LCFIISQNCSSATMSTYSYTFLCSMAFVSHLSHLCTRLNQFLDTINLVVTLLGSNDADGVPDLSQVKGDMRIERYNQNI